MNYKYVVYENRVNGSRFMTNYDKEIIYDDDDVNFVVNTNVTKKMATMLCDEKTDNSIKSYLNSPPSDLRNQESDDFIKKILGW